MKFFAFFKTVWEVIKIIKSIKAYFDKVYVEKLEMELKKKAEALRKATEAIEADQNKLVAEQSDEDLMKAHRNRNKQKYH